MAIDEGWRCCRNSFSILSHFFQSSIPIAPYSSQKTSDLLNTKSASFFYVCSYWLGWLKIGSFLKFILPLEKMRPFPSWIKIPKFGNNRIKFTRDPTPPLFSIGNEKEGFSPQMLPILYNGKWVGRWSWVNFIQSPPNLGFLMYEGNDRIFSDGIMRFDLKHTLGHPIVDLWDLPQETNEKIWTVSGSATEGG